MKAKTIFLTVALLFVFNGIYSQGFQPPAPGKAVVYFVRTAGYWKVTYYFFHQNVFIGDFKHKDYIRYECPPGKQLFWAKSENAEFIEADLKEGGTYIIHVDIIFGTGFAKSNVGFTPVSYSEKERFDPCKEFILKKPPVSQSAAYLEKMKKKFKKTIDKNLELYETKWKNEKNFRHITQDMEIPIKEIK
jgi:hypothetical protein